MCMEDVRLGRATVTRVKAVTIAAGSTETILPQEADRVSVLLAPVAAGTGFIRFGANDVNSLTGIPIAGMQWPLILNLQFNGDLCRQELIGQAVGGDLTVYTVATYLETQ